MTISLDEVRKERERFVAFAFAAAEIFFEIDPAGIIQFEGGAFERLSPKEGSLIGKPFTDLVNADDRDVLNALFEHLAHRGRIGPMPLRFIGGNGRDIGLRLFALRMDTPETRTFVSLRSAPLTHTDSSGTTDPATGLLSKSSFMELTAKTMSESAGNSNLYMTAVEVDGLDEARHELGQKRAESLLRRIGAHLKTLSVDGSTAGQIGEKQFAFLHRAESDNKVIQNSISKADETGKLVTKASTVSAEGDQDEAQVIRTLGYILKKFIDHPEACDFSSFAEAYDGLASETRSRLDQMRNTIKSGNFNLIFQPIVDLATRQIMHYEVLSRFHQTSEGGPAEVIQFAEETGLIEEFDLALCYKVIDYVRKMKRMGTPLTLALNISGRTLDTDSNAAKLVEQLTAAKDAARQIIIELNETKSIINLEKVEQILANLKEVGYRICLDDFGAGASGYQYLRAFNVDYVKIDGAYVREMERADYRPTFLMSMVRLCDDLGIKTIGEHVETQFQAEFLKSLGANFGQGYYFGRPTTSPAFHV